MTEDIKTQDTVTEGTQPESFPTCADCKHYRHENACAWLPTSTATRPERQACGQFAGVDVPSSPGARARTAALHNEIVAIEFQAIPPVGESV